jgi:magnesium-transporting ATPase (P-type)
MSETQPILGKNKSGGRPGAVEMSSMPSGPASEAVPSTEQFAATDSPDDISAPRFKKGGKQNSDLGQYRAPTASGYAEVEVKDADAYGAVDDTTYPALDGTRDPLGEPGDGGNNLLSTDFEYGLTKEEAERRIERFGYNELPEKEKNIWLLLLKEFIQPMPCIVWTAMILEFVESLIEWGDNDSGDGDSDMADVGALFFLQFLNVFVGFFEELKADEAIKALKKSLLPSCNVIRDGHAETVPARNVVVGDIVLLVLGAAIACDGTILPGKARVQVDESQINGESLPKTVKANERVLMGTVVKSGESVIICRATGQYTEFGKTASLLVEKEDKGHFEELLQLLLWVLVVLGLVVNLIIIIFLETKSDKPKFLDVLSFAVVLLIASIPIALRVVCVTTLALGCRELSEEGAIVSKINAVEEIASMTLLCSDKTGTLTQNKMAMIDDNDDIGHLAWRNEGVSFNMLLQHAALAAKWWEKPGDALDTLVLHYVCKYRPIQSALQELYQFDEDFFQPFDASKKRTQSTIVPKKGKAGIKEKATAEKAPDDAKSGKFEYSVLKLPMAKCQSPDTDEGASDEQKLAEATTEQLTMPDGSTEAFVINYHTDGRPFKVTKGAPHVVLAMIDKPERDRISESYEAAVKSLGEKGVRSLAVAISYDDVRLEEGAGKGWTMLGLIAFRDPVRPDTKITVDLCKKLGVDVKMVTGDQKLIAIETSRELGLDTNVLAVTKNENGTTTPLPTYEKATDLVELAEDKVNKPLARDYGQICLDAGGFAQVYPEHKYLIVAALQQWKSATNEPVGMTGDGVNDAPALHRANIGIAVEGSTDAARGAADIVLTYPGLSAVVSSIVVSRKIFTRMKNFVVYRIACTLQLLFFFLIACLTFNPKHYCADKGFFYLPVSALVTIVILNDGTIISVAFDNVDSSEDPEEWNMFVLTIVSSVVGGVALMSSVLILDWALNAQRNHQANHRERCHAGKHCNAEGLCTNVKYFLTHTNMETGFELSNMTYEQVRTMIYLKIALSDYLSLFNSRCQGWFFSRRPSWHVATAALFSTLCSTILACYWPFGSDMKGISWPVAGFVWLFVMCFGIVQDSCKVLTYFILKRLKYVKEARPIDEVEFDEKMAEGRAEAHRVAAVKAANQLKVLQILG